VKKENVMFTGMMGGLDWAGMGLMSLWMLVPLGLFVAVVWLVATAASGRDRPRSDDDANAILRRRLAAGEISIDQYEQARAALGYPTADPSRS
jgi:uncharacterized membrane protein